MLLPQAVLARAVRGRDTYERVDLYAAAARELGLRLVLFSPHGCRPERGWVRGYVPGPRGWIPWQGPLPDAVHNRLLTPTRRYRPLLRALARRLGPRLFNPPVSRDKWRVHRLLSAHPAVRAHLPATWPLTAARCRRVPRLVRRHGELVAKPRLGGVGLGVIAIRWLGGDRFRWIAPAGRRRVSGSALTRRLQRLAVQQRYLVQEGIPLATYRGRRFDLRVPVQRDGTGQWTVPGAAVKRAWRHPF